MISTGAQDNLFESAVATKFTTSDEQISSHETPSPEIGKLTKKVSESLAAHPSRCLNSTNEFSADSQGRSKNYGERMDSQQQSDCEDAVFVPFKYNGDGRKREAKKHKLQALVAKDEIILDQMIREYQDSNKKVIE